MSNRIQELRKKKNLTLHELEIETGIRDVNLSRYERGIVDPKEETWEKLAVFFNVPSAYLQGLDSQAEVYIDKFMTSMKSEAKNNIHGFANAIRKGNDIMLSIQLNRVQNNELRPMESSTLSVAIKLVMDLYDKYDFNSEETTEISTILNALTFMINNSIDDDDDYQNTIDDFTKLVNNLKEQNKKASD